MQPVTTTLTEAFLHYIWRTLRFDFSDLRTLDGRSVRIRKPGIWNHHQGPDFLQAHLEIGGVEWHGHVELHLHSDDWYRHGHERDPGYNNTVLHVVLDSNGRAVMRQDGTVIPELALRSRLPASLIGEYRALQDTDLRIPCANQLHRVEASTQRAWIERLGKERLLARARALSSSQEKDWDQVVWEEVAALMGGPVNREAFRALAQLLPYPLLARYREQPHRIEALLFGLAGFLDTDLQGDEYHELLRQTWDFLREKHQLPALAPVPPRFLRMRPAAFPSLRLAQLAAWLRQWPHPARLLQPEGFHAFLHTPVVPHPYWRTHYRFGLAAPLRKKQIGKSQKIILLINVLIPLAYCYHHFHGRPDPAQLLETALAALPPEDNHIIRAFGELGLHPDHALHSQGLIELKKNYCNPRRCLECEIGQEILGEFRV